MFDWFEIKAQIFKVGAFSPRYAFLDSPRSLFRRRSLFVFSFLSYKSPSSSCLCVVLFKSHVMNSNVVFLEASLALLTCSKSRFAVRRKNIRLHSKNSFVFDKDTAVDLESLLLYREEQLRTERNEGLCRKYFNAAWTRIQSESLKLLPYPQTYCYYKHLQGFYIFKTGRTCQTHPKKCDNDTRIIDKAFV